VVALIAALHASVQRLGWLAPPAFVAATVLALMLLVVPAWVCTLLAGALFGPVLGTIAALIGITAGASAVFAMARAGLVGLRPAKSGLAARVAAELRQGAVPYVIALRLVPVFPFTLINLVAGAAGMAPLRFALGTFIGVIPSTLIYASLGDALIDLAQRGETFDAGLLQRPPVLVPLLALAALAVSPVLLRRRSRRE
jgi:uncharacterized membrane protein YdjX (TVP38/TMEM64 family)